MSLFEQCWDTPRARAAVVVVHGTGEHSGRYRHVAERLNRHGYSVYSGDLPGWGRSPGRRGHIDSFDDYLEAVGRWVAAAASRTPSRTVYLLGHSMGGLVAARFAQTAPERSELAGLILSSPCLGLKLAVPLWKARAAQWLDRLWPGLRLPNGIPPHDVTRDPDVRRQYRADPLNYHLVSVRWFIELNRAMAEARRDAPLVELPLLVLQAGDDRLIDAAAVQAFVEAVPIQDKTYVPFPGLYHEVFNEPEREEVLDRLIRWLDERTKPAGEM